jgi:hypothetical protein
MARRHELHTADGKNIEDLLEMARTLFDRYNEAERPFKDMFAETVSEQTFYQEPRRDDIYWDKISEGEQPRSMREEDYEDKWMTIRSDTYSKSLGMSQKYIRRTDSSTIVNKLQRMLTGAKNTEEQLIYNTLTNGIIDGSGAWYDIRDFGEYSFANDHSHVFEQTDDLFDDDGTDDTAYEAHEHVEEAKRELTHHGMEGPFVALVSNSFKRSLRDELSWDAQYHIPMATGMRSADVQDLDIVIDGVRLVESPWMAGDKMYVTQASNDSPIKFLEDRPVQVTRPNGAVVRSPGDLLGANATADYGCRMADPLAAVEVNATNVK